MKTLLISQGGCGTNWLKARYGAANVCAGLPDMNPHQRLPYAPDGAKVLYLLADPISQLYSFEKRGFFGNCMAVRNLGGNEIAFRRIMPDGTLAKYAELGINCFRFAEHRAGWQTYCLNNDVPIAFVSYESLEDPDKLTDLDAWVGGMDNDLPFSGRSETYINLPLPLIAQLIKTHSKDINDYQFVRNQYASR